MSGVKSNKKFCFGNVVNIRFNKIFSRFPVHLF